MTKESRSTKYEAYNVIIVGDRCVGFARVSLGYTATLKRWIHTRVHVLLLNILID